MVELYKNTEDASKCSKPGCIFSLLLVKYIYSSERGIKHKSSKFKAFVNFDEAKNIVQVHFEIPGRKIDEKIEEIELTKFI